MEEPTATEKRMRTIDGSRGEAEVSIRTEELGGFKIVIDRQLLDDEKTGRIWADVLTSPPGSMEAVEDVLRTANAVQTDYEVGVRLDAGLLKIVAGGAADDVLGKTVTFSDLLDTPTRGHEDASLSGKVVTHSHPGGGPLSGGDLAKLAEYEMKEVRAVGITTTVVGRGETPSESEARLLALEPPDRQLCVSNTCPDRPDDADHWSKVCTVEALRGDRDLAQWWAVACTAATFGWTFHDGTAPNPRNPCAYFEKLLEHRTKPGSQPGLAQAGKQLSAFQPRALQVAWPAAGTAGQPPSTPPSGHQRRGSLSATGEGRQRSVESRQLRKSK